MFFLYEKQMKFTCTNLDLTKPTWSAFVPLSVSCWQYNQMQNACIFIIISVYIVFMLTTELYLTEMVPLDGSVLVGKKSGFSTAAVTHVSGEIFIWPSTIRHSELERIIHSSIISLPLCGPLLSDLLAFPAFPQLRRFIPAAAAIRISPAIVPRWLQDKRMKLGQHKVRLQVLRSQCKHRKREACKVQWNSWWLSGQWE